MPGQRDSGRGTDIAEACTKRLAHLLLLPGAAIQPSRPDYRIPGPLGMSICCTEFRVTGDGLTDLKDLIWR